MRLSFYRQRPPRVDMDDIELLERAVAATSDPRAILCDNEEKGNNANVYWVTDDVAVKVYKSVDPDFKRLHKTSNTVNNAMYEFIVGSHVRACGFNASKMHGIVVFPDELSVFGFSSGLLMQRLYLEDLSNIPRRTVEKYLRKHDARRRSIPKDTGMVMSDWRNRNTGYDTKTKAMYFYDFTRWEPLRDGTLDALRKLYVPRVIHFGNAEELAARVE